MSTIEKNLRIDLMRRRMLDKNTLDVKGALYVGTGNIDAYKIYEVDVLRPDNNNGLPLTIAQGGGVAYQQLHAEAFTTKSFPGSGLDPDIELPAGETQPDSLFIGHSIGPDHFSAGWGFSLEKFSHLVNTSGNSITWNGLDIAINHTNTNTQSGRLTLTTTNKDAYCDTVETASKSNKTPSGYIPTLWGSPDNFIGKKKTICVHNVGGNWTLKAYGSGSGVSSFTFNLPVNSSQVLGITANVRPVVDKSEPKAASWCYRVSIPFKPGYNVRALIPWEGHYNTSATGNRGYDQGCLFCDVNTLSTSIQIYNGEGKGRSQPYDFEIDSIRVLYYR